MPGSKTDQDSRGSGNAEPESAKGKRPKMFSRAGLSVFAVIVVVEAVAFGLVFFMGMGSSDSRDAFASGPGGDGEPALEVTAVDLESLDQIEPWIIDLGEITVYPKSTQKIAPYRITSEVKIVISRKLGEALMGDGDKESKTVKVIKLNIRQVISKMLEEYALRILDNSAKEAFQHEAKTRLNNGQVEGDREMSKILRVLRGHVLQVILDRLEQSSF